MVYTLKPFVNWMVVFNFAAAGCRRRHCHRRHLRCRHLHCLCRSKSNSTRPVLLFFCVARSTFWCLNCHSVDAYTHIYTEIHHRDGEREKKRKRVREREIPSKRKKESEKGIAHTMSKTKRQRIIKKEISKASSIWPQSVLLNAKHAKKKSLSNGIFCVHVLVCERRILKEKNCLL